VGSRRTKRRSAGRKRSGLRKGVPRGYADVPSYEEIVVKLRCGRCHRTLEAEGNFYPKVGSKSGYQNECIQCRKEINKKYPRKKKKSGEERRESGSRKRANLKDFVKGGEKKRLAMERAADKIKVGEVVGPTTRTLIYPLIVIIEYQLRIFYSRGVCGPVGSRKLETLIGDAMFEIKESLSRIAHRVRQVDWKVLDGGLEKGFLQDEIEEDKAREILGVGKRASEKEIKSKYRDLAKKSHPDVGGSEEMMAELNGALEVLTGGKNGC